MNDENQDGTVVPFDDTTMVDFDLDDLTGRRGTAVTTFTGGDVKTD